MPYSQKTKTLNRLHDLTVKQADLLAEIDATIDSARAENFDGEPLCSWAEIAAYLGISRQGAWERWGKRA